MTPVLRALVWLAVSSGILLAGFALLAAALLVPSVLAHGALPGPLQRDALGLVYSSIARQALLPELALTLVTWLALARIAPALERSWRFLALALPAVALLWFPFVGSHLFAIWSPGGARDYAATMVAVSGGAALALLLPRWLSSALAPGCFAAPPKRGIVAPR
ncbi:MAG: hypothetical protein ACHQ6T_07645 [Myxococcota bacterium]